MIKDSREMEPPNKAGGGGKANRPELRPSSGTWPPFQNSRIVRVSRAFAGKDRHSKVSTLRGLRDRRVRLSMPTAIQIYDLQDKLGLSQPSKVVDWLINAAQHEIDKLPPLQFPQSWAFSSAIDAEGANDEQNQLNLRSSNSNSCYNSSQFPKPIHQSSEALLSTSYHQIESHDPDSFPAMQSFSSYLACAGDFETMRPFAQFPPANFKQYCIHQEEARRGDSLSGEAEVYEDCGAAHGSNAADFFL